MVSAKSYWDNRYKEGGNSGYGSYGEQLQKKLMWLSDLPIKSISELGCGDLNFATELLKYYPDAKYAGQDISNEILMQHRQKMLGHFFSTSPDELPQADLLLCIDVLFHVLDDADYDKLLEDIRRHWTKYLAITAYERDGLLHEEGNHLKIRKFDYKSFGIPIIRQVVEEDGQLYFYLFHR